MTTLKDKINDVIIEYYEDEDPDPEVLLEAIMEEIKEYITNVLLTE